MFASLVAVAAYAILAWAGPVDIGMEIPGVDDGLPGQGPLRRSDWFRGVWRERRQLFASTQQQDMEAVVFLGDSITQGWGDQLVTLFPAVHTANRGISGDTSRGVLLRLEGDVLALRPRGLVVLIGTNDLQEGAEPETIADNLGEILEAVSESQPTMPIILCSVFPSSASQHRPADKIRRLNQLYAELSLDYPQVTFLDNWTPFANPQGDANPQEFPDLLHLSPAAYIKWAQLLDPVLAQRGLR